MACYFPRPVWRKALPNPESGKFGYTFRISEALVGTSSYSVACGKCIGCRLDWAGDWAARCEKEAQMWPRNCFITLTYSDEHLPLGARGRSSVSKREWQLFMKRLRKAHGDGIRFFACGEYGSKNERAHYHAILFNHDFDDKRVWQSADSGNLYVSSELERLWPFGFSTVGAVTFQSAAYVARYVMKKLDGELADYSDREPPFVLMSRRPGIGTKWLMAFGPDVYGLDKDGRPRGELVVGDGRVRRPGRFFDGKFRAACPDEWMELKVRRRLAPRRVVPPGEGGRRLWSQNENAKSVLANHSRSL